jgi:hypothetical protein
VAKKADPIVTQPLPAAAGNAGAPGVSEPAPMRPAHHEIELLAYKLWLETGQCAEHNWAEAERLLSERLAQITANRAPRA